MKWSILPAALAGMLVFGGEAESQSMTGCWNYAADDVYSTVCFNAAGGGTFNLDWAANDPDQGWIKGSCLGSLTVASISGGRIDFSVPYQEDACRLEAEVIRMSQRDYSCDVNGREMTCSLIVYYDDGTVFRQVAGLKYFR